VSLRRVEQQALLRRLARGLTAFRYAHNPTEPSLQ